MHIAKMIAQIPTESFPSLNRKKRRSGQEIKYRCKLQLWFGHRAGAIPEEIRIRDRGLGPRPRMKKL